jgi:hypothetical protein
MNVVRGALAGVVVLSTVCAVFWCWSKDRFFLSLCVVGGGSLLAAWLI